MKNPPCDREKGSETMRVERSASIWYGRIKRVEIFDQMGFGVIGIQKCKQISAEKWIQKVL